MPIFEYTCGSCGKEFEALMRASSHAPECPACHGTELQKKLSVFAAVTGATATGREMPEACGSCGHPGGPGACQFE